MQYPYMLIMRNTSGGSIWQAYEVRDDKEVELLTKSATHNGFIVQKEPAGYTNETTPGWRDSQEWKDYRAGKLSERAQGQAAAREILKNIRRDGPYWLGGYNDWLISCFSIRNPGDLHGFTPIACWSDLSKDAKHPHGYCAQYLVCVKDGQYFVDAFMGYEGQHGVGGYGIDPKPAESQIYPTHIYDWIFKDVIPKHRGEIPTAEGTVCPPPAVDERAGIPSVVAIDVTASARRPRKRPVAKLRSA